jgi:hypothetical protein
MLRLLWLCLHVLILGRAPKKPCRLESCLCGMAPWRPPAADYCSAGFCDEHCAKRCGCAQALVEQIKTDRRELARLLEEPR